MWTVAEAVEAAVEEQGPILDLLREPALLSRHGTTLREAVREGWVRALPRRGLYEVVALPSWQPHDELSLVPALVAGADYYVSWWSALSLHGLTEQLPRSVWVAVKGVYRPGRSVGGARYRFVRLAPQKFFGTYPHRVGRTTVQVANRAKAVVDAVDHPEYSGGIFEVAKAVASPRVSAAELIEAARRQGVRSVAQRLGWLIENVRQEDAGALRPMRNSGRAVLVSPGGDQPSHHDPRWNLLVNVDAASLRERMLT